MVYDQLALALGRTRRFMSLVPVSIGFRPLSDGFAFVALTGTQTAPQLEASGRYEFPSNLAWPAQLSWLRKQLRELVTRFNIVGASIKCIEPLAKKKSSERIQIQGVIIEFLWTEKTISCTPRIKSQIRRDVRGFEQPARYIDRALDVSPKLLDLKDSALKEAALVAIAELD